MIIKLTCQLNSRRLLANLIISLLVGQELDLTVLEPKCTGLTIFCDFLVSWKPISGFGKRLGLVDKLNRSGQVVAEVWGGNGHLTVTH